MITAAVILILLHAPDGREIRINPDSITSMRSGDGDNKLVTPNAACLINLADGKHVAVLEECDDVRRKAEEAR